MNKGAGYEFSSTQFPLSAELAASVRTIARDIQPQDLVRKEFSPHITLKHGLHTADAQTVKSVFGGEKSISVKLGKTSFFSAHENGGDHDVVKIDVFSPELRRLYRKIVGILPHTTEHPKYQPHITVAYVKKGKGQKYAGRSDLEGKVVTFDALQFSNKSGRKTLIELVKGSEFRPDNQWWTRAPVAMGAGGIGGAALGRYLLAPILTRLLGLNPRTAKRNLTLVGGLAGLLPGLLHGLTMKKLRGSFNAPMGPPRNYGEWRRHVKYTKGRSRQQYDSKPRPSSEQRMREQAQLNPSLKTPRLLVGSSEKASADGGVWSEHLWNPSFPVAQSMDEIANNPLIPPMHKAKMQMLIAEAGRSQGVGRTGLASAGSLMRALPNVVSHAVPAVGGAWAVSKILGAPRRLKNTAVGSALVYAALKGFMDKGI